MPSSHNILWSERDAGQKFSIVMIALFVIASAALMSYATINSAIAGDWDSALLSGGALMATVPFFLQWRRRNAR